MILDRILSYKRQFVAECKARIPLDQVQAAAKRAPAPLDFCAVLRRERGCVVIAEIKKASPSKGSIREDFDPVAIGMAYQTHGAAAVSCLTDERFFQGSLDIFRSVRQAIRLPMLRKEFIIDEYQIHEARGAGADAVLLIASVLDDEQLRGFRALAESQGMAALVETHTEADARRAVDSGATLIGVNNRDLASPDFHTDLRHSEAIAPLLPAEAIRVSESGIATREDVLYLEGLGFDAILAGERLMRHADPGQALALLTGEAPRNAS